MFTFNVTTLNIINTITDYKPISLLSVYSPYLHVEVFLNQNDLAMLNLANIVISNVSLQSKIVEGVRACRKSQLLNEWKIVFVTLSAFINIDYYMLRA